MSDKETLPVGLIAYGVVAILIVLAVWQFINGRVATKLDTAPPKVQEGRLAILPFVNKTKQASYEVLGYMAADWIAQVLGQTRGDQVVSLSEVLKHLDKADPDGKSRDFANATEAEYFLLGSYDMEDNSLVMRMKLIGAKSGMSIDRFPEISVGVNDPLPLLTEAGKMIQKYFEVDSARIGSSNPPEYETYRSHIQEKMETIQSR